jgi:hypothetical protein
MTEREEGFMQQHLCECMIDIANEKTNVQYRGAENPVPWPEILVLQAVHGDQAIYDIRPIALGPRETPAREKERMTLIYGRDIVESVYAGKSIHIEWFMPGWPINPQNAPPKKAGSDRPTRVGRRRPEDENALDARI